MSRNRELIWRILWLVVSIAVLVDFVVDKRGRTLKAIVGIATSLVLMWLRTKERGGRDPWNDRDPP